MTEEEHTEEFICICVAVFRDLAARGQLDEFLREGDPHYARFKKRSD